MEQQIYTILKNKIIFMLTNDLTIGQTDNDKKSFTNNEIEEFIKGNDEKIEKTIENMIYDYKEDDDLELLKEPLLDWIGEYLYSHIDTQNI